MNQSIISHSLVAILFLIIGIGIGYASFNNSFTTDTVAGITDTSNSADTQLSAEETGKDARNQAVDVKSNNLTEEQLSLARALGIDPKNVTITQEMIVCAESKLGADRVEEIKNGATPSFGEGVTLAGCYTSG